MPPVTASLLTALPSAAQARLRAVGDAHRTEFGTCRRYQAAFDEHVGFFDTLIARGASHAVIGKLLAEVGIARADGSPLPLGTISGALSRARERAAAAGSSALAVLRLMTSSNLVGYSIGRSPGFSPLNILLILIEARRHMSIWFSP